MLGEGGVHHPDAPLLAHLTRDRVRHGHDLLTDTGAEPAVHPDRDIHVGAGDLPRGVRGADLCQVHPVVAAAPGPGVAVSAGAGVTAGGQAGGVGVPTGPPRVQAEGGAGERGRPAGPPRTRGTTSSRSSTSASSLR